MRIIAISDKSGCLYRIPDMFIYVNGSSIVKPFFKTTLVRMNFGTDALFYLKNLVVFGFPSVTTSSS